MDLSDHTRQLCYFYLKMLFADTYMKLLKLIIICYLHIDIFKYYVISEYEINLLLSLLNKLL